MDTFALAHFEILTASHCPVRHKELKGFSWLSHVEATGNMLHCSNVRNISIAYVDDP